MNRFGLFLIGVSVCLGSVRVSAAERLNIVFIVTDKHGAWTLGCYGNPDIRTPNIDRLAADDLMMQVPLVFRHPGQIPAGTSNQLVASYDFLATLLDYLGLSDELPSEPKSPGRSFAPALRGEPQTRWETEMIYEMEGCRSIRTEDWKYVERRSPDGPGEFYDMKNDPHERFNLYGQPHVASEQAKLAEQLYAFFDEYAEPEYDIWRGGRSKARRLYAPEDHPDDRPLRR